MLQYLVEAYYNDGFVFFEFGEKNKHIRILSFSLFYCSFNIVVLVLVHVL